MAHPQGVLPQAGPDGIRRHRDGRPSPADRSPDSGTHPGGLFPSASRSVHFRKDDIWNQGKTARENRMIRKKIRLSLLLAAGFLSFSVAGSPFAGGGDPPLSTYGAGAIRVRIYSDYCCPPCRGMEPQAESLLRDLVKRKRIQVTFVDTPFHKNSSLYIRYFLFALKAKNDLEQALKVRRVLFEAASREDVTTKEGIESLFRSRRIPFTVYEPRPTFDRFQALIREDGVHSTPTCVLIGKTGKETITGRFDIVKALQGLK